MHAEQVWWVASGTQRAFSHGLALKAVNSLPKTTAPPAPCPTAAPPIPQHPGELSLKGSSWKHLLTKRKQTLHCSLATGAQGVTQHCSVPSFGWLCSGTHKRGVAGPSLECDRASDLCSAGGQTAFCSCGLHVQSSLFPRQ